MNDKILSKFKHIYRTFSYRFLRNVGDNSYKYFHYPWDETYTQRIAWIKGKSDTQRSIAFIYPAPESGTFRYRSYNTSQILNKHENYRASYFFASDIPALEVDLAAFDVLIFTRVEWSPEAQSLVLAAKKAGVKTVFDFDDMVFNVDNVPDLLEQIAAPASANGYYFYYVSIITTLAKMCDSYLATNEFLAGKVSAYFGKPCAVIPNFMNTEQLEIGERINNGEFPEVNLARKKRYIGYFSGTKTHDRDFKLVEDDLIRVLKDYPDVKLLLVGHLNLSGKFDQYQGRIVREGMKNFIEQKKYIAMCAINLIPLHVNDFTNCKSELKFFEAGLVKVPSIASPTYVYKQNITDGENGLLAEPDEWYEKMKLLLDNPQQAQAMGEAAHIYALKNYSGELVVKKIETALELLRG